MKVFLIHLFYMKNYPKLLDVSTKTVIDPTSMTYVTTPTYTMKCMSENLDLDPRSSNGSN